MQEKALKSPDAMYEFLCSGLYPGVKAQQPDALRRRAELFYSLLSEQLTASTVLTRLDSLAPEAAPAKVCLLDADPYWHKHTITTTTTTTTTTTITSG